jgi:hypothetical protein
MELTKEFAGLNVKINSSNTLHDIRSPNMKQLQMIWRCWAKALGQKASNNDSEADVIAIIRTVILMSYLITNCFIIYGVTRAHIFPATQKPIRIHFLNWHKGTPQMPLDAL